MKQPKFYEFKNVTEESADLYVYGAIIWDHDGWFEYESDVSPMDFKRDLEALGDNVKQLNIYINSPGGNVFAASAMISMLERTKANGVTITAYVDGISASAASFLMMVADEIKLYKNSTVMVHKPMGGAWGNVHEIQKTIDALNTVESSVMIPMYMSKAKSDQEKITALIDAESWLSASEMEEHFKVTLLDSEKIAVASFAPDVFKHYKNAPEHLAAQASPKQPIAKEPEKSDNTSVIKVRLAEIKGSIISKKLKEINNDEQKNA